ncbi:hypothetical protein SLS61_002620 [Didymella pomorum]
MFAGEALERPTDSTTAILEQEYDRSSPEISGVLTRRKSLVQAPGVATRISPVEGQRRTWNSWKAPQLRPGDEAKWQAPKQGPSPLDRLKALDLADSTQAKPPGDMDYSHLLGYKPGTLMVVNGEPSPAPSTVNLTLAGQPNQRNDYFFVNEPAASPLATKSGRKQTKHRSMSAVGVRDSSAKAQADPASEEKIAITYIKPETKPKKRPQSIAVTTRRASQSADTLARDYQAYIPYSPFENQMVIHNIWKEQEATTDELFLEEFQPQQRPDNLVELSATITDVSELSPPSTATSTNTLETPKNRTLRPSPRTSDSGYSSIGSSGGGTKVPTNEEQRQQHPQALRVASPPADSPHALYGMSRRQIMSFELPIQGGASHSFEQSLLATVPKRPHGHGRTLSLDIPRDIAELPSMDSVLTPATPQSATTRKTEKQPPRQPRRLQKRRPSQPQLPVVQSALLSREIIPEVPDDVRFKFSRRLSATPGMECLTHTYPSKDHITSTGSTTSFSPVDPVPSPMQLEPDEAPAPPARGRRMSFFRRKSTSDKKIKDEEDRFPAAQVLDLGTIAVSLGASPYDPSMFGSFEQTEAVDNPTHPHQLGQARSHSRSRSAMSMSSDTAAEYARMRSKDRALPEPEMPEIPQRKPRRKPRMEIGEAKQSKRRPQTFYFDEAPPMPAIDHAKYAAPLSARPRLEDVDTPTANQSRVRANSRPQSPLRPNHTRPPSAHKNVDWEQKVDWEQHALQWAKRRQSLGDSLRPRPTVEAKENVAPAPRARPMSYTAHELTTFGRYSGGLDYDHEGHGQIGGSAGTRQLHSYASQKSMHFKQSYGVDLSDVPIFVQRQQ